MNSGTVAITYYGGLMKNVKMGRIPSNAHSLGFIHMYFNFTIQCNWEANERPDRYFIGQSVCYKVEHRYIDVKWFFF